MRRARQMAFTKLQQPLPFLRFSSVSKLCLLRKERRCRGCSSLTMVTSREERRAAEMRRLAAQLKELKAERERLLRGKVMKEVSSFKQEKLRKETDGLGTGVTEGDAHVADDDQRRTKDDLVQERTRKSRVKFGLHGESNRFLAVSTVDGAEYFPRVIPVVGPLETLTSAEFLGVRGVSNAVGKGQISIATLGQGSIQGDLVGIPGVEIVAKASDPIAVVAGSAGSLGLQYPGKDGGEKGPAVLLVIERDWRRFEWRDGGFYLWNVVEEGKRKDGGFVRFGWSEKEPGEEDGVECIGETLLCFMEVPEQVGKERSCWQEVDEVW